LRSKYDFKGELEVPESNKSSGFEKPYIRAVLEELKSFGCNNEDAKIITLRHYRVMKRTLGFYLNAGDFAKELYRLEIASRVKYDKNNPDHIPLEPIRERLRQTKASKIQKKHPESH
jgi:hypothetical protein